MHKFRFGQKQTKSLIVSMMMAAVIAVPMFAQPLGLALTSAAPVADTNEAQQALLSPETTPDLEPLESVDTLDIDLNRSRLEAGLDEEALTAGMDADQADDEIALPDENGDIDVEDPSQAGAPDAAAEPADNVTAIDARAAFIAKSGVNLRAAPDTSSAVLAQLSMGAKVTLTGELPGWKRVQDAAGREGYVAENFITQSMPFADKNDTVYVTKNGVNLRQEPSSGAASLGVMSANTKLTRTGIGDGWTRVRNAAGKTGYVASSFLTATAPRTTAKSSGTTAAPVNSSGNRVVDIAYSMLGVRYVFSSESRSGVDCSGLIYYCYSQVGISVPRSSFEYANFGTAVTLATMQPGDVIAMDTRRSDGRTSITHVGLYVGGGQMIHASSSIGRVVKTSVAQYLSYGIKLITIRRIRG